jgi:ATP-binding cassette subfamily B protein
VKIWIWGKGAAPKVWSWRDLLRTLPFLRPYRLKVGYSLALTVVAALASLLEPWPLALMIDCVLGKRPPPAFLGAVIGNGRVRLLFFLVTAGVIITVVRNTVTVLTEYLNTKIEQHVILDFRCDLFQHVQRLSLAFHDRRRMGEIMMRLNYSSASVGRLPLMFPPLAQSSITLIGMFFIAYRINSQLAFLSLTVVPFIYYSIAYYGTRITPKVREARVLEAGILSITHEAMSMLRVILAFGREQHEYQRLRRQGQAAVNARVRITVRQTLFSLAVQTVTAIGTALVLGFGAYRVLRGDLTTGTLVVLLAYIAAVYHPLEAISGSMSTMQEQLVSLRYSLELRDAEPEVKDAPDAISIRRAEGHLTFEGVSFNYAKRRGTLGGISFEAGAGRVIGIVGPTGAGKSTLVSLIPRFYDPQRGRILLDGTDIKRLTLESLRRQISIVLQEPLLFSGTVTENILYGRLDASMEDVIEAARAANAHDFITKLPDRYDTNVGERGAQLSGGERQRLCVARAFLRDAPILILDEPTSSIDSKTEGVILEALDRLMVGRTTFMIAHRLSTIRQADLILVLDHGKIVEQGPPEDLAHSGGLFNQLLDAQAPALRRPPLADGNGGGSEGTRQEAQPQAPIAKDSSRTIGSSSVAWTPWDPAS